MRKILLLLLVGTSLITTAQINTTVSEVTRPTPSVAALMNFSDIPVDYFTGVPDISIPIHDFSTRSKDVNLNIGLKYHSSSIGIQDKASDVGLGWSLFCGGSIARTITYEPDETYANITNPHNVPSVFNDTYSFNFMGYSGSFLLKRDIPTNTFSIQIKDDNNAKLKIDYSINTTTLKVDYFTIHDNRGYKYIFDVIDLNVSSFFLHPTYNQLNKQALQYRSAHHLSRVEDNNGKVLINFSYTQFNINVHESTLYDNIIHKLNEVTIHGFGKAIFNYTSSGGENEKNEAAQLNQVTIENYNLNTIKNIHFVYNAGNSLINRRLLGQVRFTNNDSSAELKYKLSYKDPTPPEINLEDYDIGHDEFGYLNFSPNCAVNNGGGYVPNIKTDPTFCMTGVLESIVYPAGGCAIFDFESNTFSNSVNTGYIGAAINPANETEYYYLANEIDNVTPTTFASIDYNTSTSSSYQFTLTQAKKLYFKFSHEPFSYPPGIEPDPNNPLPLQVTYVLHNSNGYPSINLNSNNLYESFECLGNSLTLIPGTYTITYTTGSNNTSTTGNITLTEKVNNPTQKKWVYGNGVRIKRIAHFEKEVYPYYFYQDPPSDEIPTKLINYDYTKFDDVNKSSGEFVYGYLTNIYSEGLVVYTNVKVTQTPSIGYELFTFETPYKFPIIPQGNYFPHILSLRKGNLLNHKVYSLSNKLLSETENVYEYEEDNNPVLNYLSNVSSYNTKSSWAKLATKISRNYYYDANDNPSVVQTTKGFLYNSTNKQISESTTSNSLQETLKTKYFYHTGSTSITRNRISEIEKIETYRGTELLSTSQINYATTWASNVSYLPQTILSSKGGQSLESRVSFSSYDEFSNPTELQQVGGTVITYLWGYNKTQPIAKIENATNIQVASALGFSNVNLVNESNLTAINNLRTNASLANAMITTFTYIPLVGISTITDPKGDKLTYEYDLFNRLKWVLDKDDYILSENEYHYRTNSADFNYVKSTTYKTETETSIASPTISQAVVNKTFFDGAGRAIQQIAHQQSNTGKDIVTPIAYDTFGRKTKDYLPYPTTTASLNYYPDALNEQAQYVDYFGQVAYSEKSIELSPLGRLLEQAAPGNDWSLPSPEKHTIRFDYQTNSSIDQVRLFKISAGETNYSSNGFYSIDSLIDNGYYQANELYKSVTKNENWKATDGNNNTTVEFKDKEGRLILKRTYGVSVVGGVEMSATHDTYYVYDQYNNLTYVLPPLADGTVTTSVLDELCYQYKYDKRNRIVEKKLPAKQWEYIVYDKLDRIIAAGPTLSPFSDATANTFGWTITKFDALGRNVLSAWTPGTNSSAYRNTLQDTYNNAPNPLFETRSSVGSTMNTVHFKYTNVSLPLTNYYVLSVNYFDDYSYPGAPTSFTSVMHDNSQPVFYNNTAKKPKGLATGSWIRIIEGINSPVRADVSHILYDKKARPVRHRTNNYLTGYTQVDTRILFSGKVLYTETKHKRASTNTELYTREDFTYSAQDRLITHVHKIGLLGAPQLLSKNEYDELGRVKAKRVGGTDVTTYVGLQKVDYSYNIRGWLTQINKTFDGTSNPLQQGTDPLDLFAFKINYNTVEDGLDYNGKELYNGSISETYWRTSSDNKERKYGYQYDDMNRLKNAVYQKPNTGINITNSYNESATYDKNGNIKSLRRNGDLDAADFPIEIDDLTYTYDTTRPNVLLKVDDDSNHPEGFRDGANTGTDYTYDNNGNLTSDLNKEIVSIKYNHLNLPAEIVFTGTNKKINYLYNAAGGKVVKKVTNGSTVTITDYLGGFQYTKVGSAAVVMDFFPNAEGYVACTLSGTTPVYNYVFNYTDHLGNIRVSYTWDTATSSLKILEENHYFPFGLKHTKYNKDTWQYISTAEGGYNTGTIGRVDLSRKIYQYKYNGKEYQDELGLNMYAMDMRQYDPAIARWVVQDPVVHHNYSPYSAFDNNPVYWADPSGADSTNLHGFDTEGRSKTDQWGMYVIADQRSNSIVSADGSMNFTGGDGIKTGPGALFNSAKEAAIDFGLNYNGDSIINSKELHSIIYSVNVNGEKKFSYVVPTIASETICTEQTIMDSIKKVKKINNATIEADIHSHGKETSPLVLKGLILSDANEFSGTYRNNPRGTGDLNMYFDKNNLYGKQIDGYMTAPNGGLYFYSPTTDYKPLRYEGDVPIYQFHIPVYTNLPSQPELKIKNQRLNTINPDKIKPATPLNWKLD